MINLFREKHYDVFISESSVSYTNKGEQKLTIFTPVVAVLFVVVCFLAILLMVGFVTESGKQLICIEETCLQLFPQQFYNSLQALQPYE